MANENLSRGRCGEAFWRAHHEAWCRSDLNQREYCEAEGISLKAFGNWRAKFKSEPRPPARKLLYRRGRLSHASSHCLSHGPSHPLSHVTYPSSPPVSIGCIRMMRCRSLVCWPSIFLGYTDWYRPMCRGRRGTARTTLTIVPVHRPALGVAPQFRSCCRPNGGHSLGGRSRDT
jgi:hypothetical protein